MEERLKYFETGQVPQKNLDVMAKAQVEAEGVQEKVQLLSSLFTSPKGKKTLRHKITLRFSKRRTFH